MDSSAPLSPAVLVGRSIRSHREAARLSLGALALKSGVSKSNLSKIEAGVANPSLETLWHLAGALGLSLGDLLGEAEPPRMRLIHAGEGAKVLADSGLSGEMLLSEGRPHRTEIIHFALPPGADYRSAPHQMGTEELVFCIAGQMEVGPADQEQALDVGDCLWFPADRPHHYRTTLGARGLNVISYPLLNPKEES